MDVFIVVLVIGSAIGVAYIVIGILINKVGKKALLVGKLANHVLKNLPECLLTLFNLILLITYYFFHLSLLLKFILKYCIIY